MWGLKTHSVSENANNLFNAISILVPNARMARTAGLLAVVLGQIGADL